MENPFDILINEFRELKNIVLCGAPSSVKNEEVYLKIDKAAEFLSTSESSLRVMVHRRQIKYIKKQGKLFFRQSDLIEWFESGSSEPEDLHAEDILLPVKRSAGRI